MLLSCFQQSREVLFLQKRAVCERSDEKKFMVSPNSRFQEKRSLRTLKSVRSQKSLKTLDSESQFECSERTSLKIVEEPKKIEVLRSNLEKEFNRFQSPGKLEIENRQQEKECGYRMRIEKTMAQPVPRKPLRVSIMFGQDSFKRFLSPQPAEVLGRYQLKDHHPMTPELPSLRLIANQKETSGKPQDYQQDAYSITIHETKQREEVVETLRESDKDWDLKSTHIQQNGLMLNLPLPETAKSTVSMLSDRSECDSVVMDHLPTSGKLTKLV